LKNTSLLLKKKHKLVSDIIDVYYYCDDLFVQDDKSHGATDLNVKLPVKTFSSIVSRYHTINASYP